MEVNNMSPISDQQRLAPDYRPISGEASGIIMKDTETKSAAPQPDVSKPSSGKPNEQPVVNKPVSSINTKP